VLPAFESWTGRVRDFAAERDSRELRLLRVRIEDKGPIVAFHWRGAGDETAARSAVAELAERAQADGLEVHWGRKVMEARPPVRIDKGAGVRALLKRAGSRIALYAGDDVTDVDAFRALRDLRETGKLEHAVCVGVLSEDGPDEIQAEADITVEGTGGMRELLAALASD
jgi:trehalose 6-phosphate phosphatase